ncbi:MAG: MCP four helix bundle domain-containing protein, partial [Algicola sp.]|nr:MCP four helix bundle domain-containing protein [Algicola sp.]
MQFSFSKNLGIGAKLNLGFGSIIILMIIGTVLSYSSLSDMNHSQSQVTEIRYPAVITASQLTNGINQSLAALRGYMILGNDANAATKFKTERAQAWQKIEQAITTFNTLAAHLSSDSVRRIDEVKALLKDLKTSQENIEDIAQTPGNQPALKLLSEQAGPRASQMLALLARVIEQEQEQELDEEHRELFKHLSDSRGAFAISVGGLRAYLITGESKFKDQFDTNWLINTDAYLEIDENIELLSEAQLADWQQYETLREQFAPLSIDMFRYRSSDKWNIANHMLGADVEPKVIKITSL